MEVTPAPSSNVQRRVANPSGGYKEKSPPESLVGCPEGRHTGEKPPEPVTPEVETTLKKELSESKPEFQEHSIQAPKPGDAIKRPSPDEPVTNLELKVSASIKQPPHKLKPSSGNEKK